MEAVLLYRDKYIYRDGAIREMVIWQLAEQDSDHPHRLKYRLFYGYPGKCLVRYDNERDKGDHRHYDDREEAYEWMSVTQLVIDFKADIEKLRGEQDE